MASKPKRDKQVVTTVHAICQHRGCGWRSDESNGLGAAAIHHDQTGHHVHIQQTHNIDYGAPR